MGMIRFSVERWSYWTPPRPSALAEIPEVKELLRRRASATARAALRVAFDCASTQGTTPVVFCSADGEVHRSVELLEQLSAGETLSPNGFSLSVHNTPAALFSISRGDTQPMSAVCAGPDSFAQGMFEAAIRLDDGDLARLFRNAYSLHGHENVRWDDAFAPRAYR